MTIGNFVSTHKNYLVDIVILILILIFLLAYFPFQLLFLHTTATGGDTSSHYPSLVYLRELLAQGKIMGWEQGNYAGLPLFYHYFPLTFILMIIFNFIVPMQVAFKLGSILGIFLLPICTYACFRFFKYNFPIPIVAACFSLVFLFNEGNSMWGGNILSTLAGEFSYSLGFALFIFMLGSLYYGVTENKNHLLNAIGVALVGMCHAVPFFFLGITALFFLFDTRPIKNFIYLLTVFGLGILLMGFWLIPFVWNLRWVTAFVFPWQINSVFEVIPAAFIPFLFLSIIVIIMNFRERIVHYVLYVLVMALLIFFIGPHVGILDIRFMPFFQILLILTGTVVMDKFTRGIQVKWLLPIIIFLFFALMIRGYNVNVGNWAQWNYEGFEKKSTWGVFSGINKYLQGEGNGRVLYEHTPLNNALGTLRAFETLPYFAKRNTLEGLYMMASPTSPFVFYIEALTSVQSCNPFPNYFYPIFNITRAKDYLKLFNVSQFTARTDTVKKALASDHDFKFEKKFGNYAIYRFLNNTGQYAEPLRNYPVFFKTKDWRKTAYYWFDRYQTNSTFLIFNGRHKIDITQTVTDLAKVKSIPIPGTLPVVTSYLSREAIYITTSKLHWPILIKVSYHPNWQVEGSDGIYLVSPSFMLIYPTAHKVVLSFKTGFFNYLGNGLSILGLFFLLLGVRPLTGYINKLCPQWIKNVTETLDNKIERTYRTIGKRKIVFRIVFVLIVLFAIILYHSRHYNSFYVLKQAKQAYAKQNYAKAKKLFKRVTLLSDNLGAKNEAGLFYALSCIGKGDLEEGLKGLDAFLAAYPHSYWTPQAYYEKALLLSRMAQWQEAKGLYQYIIAAFPNSVWAKYAVPKIKEIDENIAY